MNDTLHLIECPRDAMQGIDEFISTEKKVEYINQLLKVGYDTIDFGSFVSPKAIPQMRDTSSVLAGLDFSGTATKLLAIIANKRGAIDACSFERIAYLGFPFSISETFQKRNTNSSIEDSLGRVEEIQSLCVNNNKQLVIYISMAFGNPYGDLWHEDIAIKWVEKLSSQLGILIFALSDTTGVATGKTISAMFSALFADFKKLTLGAHLHTTPQTWEEKVVAAYNNGCRRFDSAIKGMGGCPLATDKLTGNMATENLLSFFDKNNIPTGIDRKAFEKSMLLANSVFPQ